MNGRFHIKLSWAAGIFGCILGLQVTWVLCAEILRPALPFFPTDRASAEATAAMREPAGTAAAVGVFRGDLSAEYALTLAADLITELEDGTAATGPDGLAAIGAALEDAATLAPHDARVWLLLALVRSRSGGDVGDPLKLSYYTGPIEVELIPLRLLVSARSGAMASPELQNLAQREIRLALTYKPELKPAIVKAHRSASPDVKRFIEATVGGLDAGFLSDIRAGRVN